METLLLSGDLGIQIASFLSPIDTMNTISSTKRLFLGTGGQPALGEDCGGDQTLSTRLMNESLRSSLVSKLDERVEFRRGFGSKNNRSASSFLSGFESITRRLGNGKVAIAGSMVVGAVLHGYTTTNNNSGSNEFRAGDIDVYVTTDSLHLIRQHLADHGFAFTGLSASKYQQLSGNSIHHVESYSFPNDESMLITLEEAFKNKLLGSTARKFLSGKDPRYTKFAMPAGFLYSKEDGLAKHVDVVVTTSQKVTQTIDSFDIDCCRSRFDGIRFVIPGLSQILNFETRLVSPQWAVLLNSYASLFIEEFSLQKFQLLRNGDGGALFNALCCIQQLRRHQGDVLFPDWSGNFVDPRLLRSIRVIYDVKYIASLHNTLVKIGKRVIKYSKGRNFHFTDITVRDFLKPQPKTEQSTPFTDNCSANGGKRDNHHRHNAQAHRSSNPNVLDWTAGNPPAKRAKLRHTKHISSPVLRVKFRQQDADGTETSSFYSLGCHV
jgi:hypothetical protein